MVYCYSTNAYIHDSFPSHGMHTLLPPEIVIKIFTNVDWRSLVCCTAVCRSWQRLICETTALQYQIELGADGLVDGPPGGLAVRDRLRLLLERRRAWRELTCTRRIAVPTPGECQAYELVGGVFAKAMSSQGLLGSRHLTMVHLPTSDSEGDSFVREDVGLLCRDFAIDPTQDLIALVQQPDTRKAAVAVHIRTISTNQSHPSASVPVLVQRLKEPFDGAIIQVFDDVVALFLLIQAIPRLLIWQWTTGKLLVHEVDSVAYRFVDDFSLISNRSFMMTSRFPFGAIKVYTFSATSNVSQAASAHQHLSVLPCTSLLLPELQDNNHYSEFTSHTAPFTAHVPTGKPFFTSEDARLHIMTIATIPSTEPQDAVGGGIGHMGNFIVVVPNRVLLQHAPLASDGANSNVEIPWEEWGPHNTRWIPERHSYAWLRYVHGSRFVRAHHGAWPSTRCRLQVVDFGVHPLRPGDDDGAEEAADAADPDVPCEHRYVRGPTVIRDPVIFRRDVESCLPYREVSTKEEFPYSGFMIDDERIIGLSAMAFANGDMKQIDVFTF